MRVIYQIGRLDSQMKSFTFIYNDKEYKDKQLSSFALKEHFGNSAKLILIYPVSLPFNRTLIDNKSSLDDNFKQRIKDIWKNNEEYLNNPKEFFKLHPHFNLADDFIIIHSIGEYEGVKFVSSYNDIVLGILFDMIDRYMENRFNELYIDISSGLNIYISALLEAARHLYVFTKLQSWNGNEVEIYKVFSEPIIGSSASEFRTFKEEMKFKTFFSSPIKKEDIDNYSLARRIIKIIEKNNEFKTKFQNCLENFALHFSALKNATPLVNYEFEKDKEEDIKDLIKKIVISGREKLNNNWKKSPSLPKDDFLKVLLSLSFYIGILKILNVIKLPNNGVDIKEIKKRFGSKKSSIYKKFAHHLNIIFVGNEISNLENHIKNYKKNFNREWIPLNEIVPRTHSQSDQRHFFAHAGFESVLVEINKCVDKIYVRYKEDVKEKIKRYLINAL